jgi:hypothetical protein
MSNVYDGSPGPAVLTLADLLYPSDNGGFLRKERKEKYPLSSQKNENSSDVVKEDEQNEGGNGGVETHKEKSPLTNDNLTSSDQQHKEKISSITDDNSSLSNNNTPNLSDKLEPKEEEKEIKFTPDYEAGEPIFSRVFEELSNDGNGLVDYDKLHGRLLSTGKFYAGEAVLMIEHMEKIGKIEQTGDYHVYRIKDSASPN